MGFLVAMILMIGLAGGPVSDIAVMPENQPEVSRIFGARQGSADDAGQEGPLGGTGKIAGRPKGGFAKQNAEDTDAGLCQKDRRIGLVHNGYTTAIAHAMPLSRKIIVLDAGHGGWDPGMVSNKVEEKGINLSITQKLQVFLEQGGATVIITRLEDKALGDKKSSDMHARRLIANTSHADIFVSIHQNSYSSSNVKGFQAFYFNESDNSMKLAGCIQDRLKEFVNPGNRLGAKANKNYFVLKQTVMPAVLVECGFLTNPGERNMLTTDEYQEKIAWGIYLGIVDYFNQAPTHS